jgi:transposase
MKPKTIRQKGKYVKSDVLVVGVDIGKMFHVAVAREPDGGFSKAYRFTSDADGFTNFKSWLDERKQGGSFMQVLVGVESTSHYWITLVAWLQRRGIEVVQVNPLHTRKAKDLYDNTPSKTDKKDARIITDLVSQGKFLRCIVPRGRYADLRYLVLVRQRLIKERTGVLNTVHRVLDVLFPEFTRVFKNLQTKTSMYLLRYCYTPALLLRHSRSRLCTRIHQVSRGTMRLEKIDELYRLAQTSVGVTDGIEGLRVMLFKALQRSGQLAWEIQAIEERLAVLVCGLAETQYLRSMPGIGLVTVATLLGESGGLRHYQSAEEVIKLAGLNLYELSSGKHRGKRRITHRGRSLLRAGLYRAAVCAVRRCGVLRAFYERLRARGKYGAVALVAVACKLMRILFSLVRDNRMFRNDSVVAR